MKEELISQINDYYKLKQKYNNSIQKQKNKIIKNPELSLKDKRDHVKLLKKQCINCKKEGGTIFSKDNYILRAVCGNTQNPCKLNISINTGDYEDIRTAKQLCIKDTEEIKTQIIRIKLDLLFNYVDEATSIKLFEKAKQDLELYNKVLLRISKQYYDVMNSSEVKRKIQELNRELFIMEEEIRKLYQKSKEESNTSYSKDVIELYISKLIPLVKTIRETKYSVCYVDHDDTLAKHFLVQKKGSISDFEYNLIED